MHAMACLLLSSVLSLWMFAALGARAGVLRHELSGSAVTVTRLAVSRDVSDHKVTKRLPLRPGTDPTDALASEGARAGGRAAASGDLADADTPAAANDAGEGGHASGEASGEASGDASGDVYGDVYGYVPASQLTERPRLLHDSAPEWPLLPVPPETNCLLLINEYGDVERVLTALAALTPAQQQALHERLMRVRFTPGSLYGRPVRTALRISVRVD